MIAGKSMPTDGIGEPLPLALGCQLDWEQLPRPDLPLIGGYVHSTAQAPGATA
ncbi:MAG: hypothetical protein ACRDR6_17190 [Pseudonocardiaceae bacterium]